MTERDINSLIGSFSDHPAWRAFVREMESKSYGYEPLTSAWGFFKKGWDARNDHGLFTSSEESVGRAQGRGEHGEPGHRCSGFCPMYGKDSLVACEHGTRGCTGRGEKHSCS